MQDRRLNATGSLPVWAALLFFIALIPGRLQAQTSEPKLEAAYLCRFADFVDWPANSFVAADSPFVIGVLGPDHFSGALDAVVQGQNSHGHPLVVKRFDDPRNATACQILFISRDETPHLNEILSQLAGRPVLTVSDAPNFAVHGGMVRFFTDKNKLRFQINLATAKSGHLSISSRLLQLADVIQERAAAP